MAPARPHCVVRWQSVAPAALVPYRRLLLVSRDVLHVHAAVRLARPRQTQPALARRTDEARVHAGIPPTGGRDLPIGAGQRRLDGPPPPRRVRVLGATPAPIVALCCCPLTQCGSAFEVETKAQSESSPLLLPRREGDDGKMGEETKGTRS